MMDTDRSYDISRPDLPSELGAKTDDAGRIGCRQRLRLRRASIGGARSVLIGIYTLYLHLSGQLAFDPVAVVPVYIAVVIAYGFFFWIISSGRNLQFRDPSLTAPQLMLLASYVRQMLSETLDAFARLDMQTALAVSRADIEVDHEYESAVRECMTFMMENVRATTLMLDVLWSIKALERIGDHATNIGEYVVHLVGGHNVRHTNVDAIAQVVASTSSAARNTSG